MTPKFLNCSTCRVSPYFKSNPKNQIPMFNTLTVMCIKTDTRNKWFAKSLTNFIRKMLQCVENFIYDHLVLCEIEEGTICYKNRNKHVTFSFGIIIRKRSNISAFGDVLLFFIIFKIRWNSTGVAVIFPSVQKF